jgi:hypothetical protein
MTSILQLAGMLQNENFYATVAVEKPQLLPPLKF